MLVAIRDLSVQLLFILKKKSELCADYHGYINGKVFEDGLDNAFLPNLL